MTTRATTDVVCACTTCGKPLGYLAKEYGAQQWQCAECGGVERAQCLVDEHGTQLIGVGAHALLGVFAIEAPADLCQDSDALKLGSCGDGDRWLKVTYPSGRVYRVALSVTNTNNIEEYEALGRAVASAVLGDWAYTGTHYADVLVGSWSDSDAGQ